MHAHLHPASLPSQAVAANRTDYPAHPTLPPYPRHQVTGIYAPPIQQHVITLTT